MAKCIVDVCTYSMRLFFLVLGLAAAVSAAPYGLKIISGHAARPGQFPYMAQIRHYGETACCASILNDLHVLTAGHCVKDENDVEDISIVVGTILNDGPDGDQYKVDSWTIHPEYFKVGDGVFNDVAIIRLERPMKFIAGQVEPIQMYRGNVGEFKSVIASGWGSTFYENGKVKGSLLLQWIGLKTISNAECKLKSEEWSDTPIIDSMLCTLTRVGEGVCHGDSGGPLVLDGQQVGITSWGNSCANGYPDVYTRIEPHLVWIHANSLI